MSDVAAAMHLLMQRLAATEAQWREEKARAEKLMLERDGVCVLLKESTAREAKLERERDEARAEVERLQGELGTQDADIIVTKSALAASQARERKLREALRGLLSRPFAKPGWSPEWDALMNAASAALAEEGP